MTRTYYVAGRGVVKRLDNLTGIWVSVNLAPSISGTLKVQLLDVETDPSNSDRVIAVGSGSTTNNTFGIYISTDAGATWTMPGGNYVTNVDITNQLIWYEVSVVDSNNIFVSGQNGYVAKSTDGGLTFNLTTQLPSLPTCSTCPSVIPPGASVHFISPVVGVVGLLAHAAYTFDAGVTWIILNGGNVITGPPNGDIYAVSGIHISADQQTIVALSFKNIFVSTDAGTTWTNVYQFAVSGVASGNGLHLTWTDDLNLWAFAKGGERARSIDGGLTWTTINGYLSTGPDQYAGHLYTTNDGFFSRDSDMLVTNDGAVTGSLSDASGVLPNIIQAVWTHLDSPICYILRDCTGQEADVVVLDDLSSYVGQVITWCSTIPYRAPLPDPQPCTPVSGCWQVLERFPPGCTCYDVNSTNKAGAVFEYTDCQTQEITSILVADETTVTICAVLNSVTITFGTGGIADIGQCETCALASCDNALPVGSIQVTGTFVDCIACLPTCYLLTDCSAVNDPIIASNDLSLYLNQVIRLATCPDDCWTVTISPTCVGSVTIGQILTSFATCLDCNPAPIIPPLELHPRRIKPGYYTAGCPPEYTEKISCTFAEQMYDEMVAIRYGINICCDHDIDKWDIKKQLLNLKALYDPNLCICFLPTCCPPTCLEASLIIFNPTTCPEPSNLSALIIIP